MKKVFIVFIIRIFCQENGRTHLALYFENEGIFISKISQIGSIPCQVYEFVLRLDSLFAGKNITIVI